MDNIQEKFRRTESSSTYQPPSRPSVIVFPHSIKEEKKNTEFCNISDASKEELLDITTICELYFLDESAIKEEKKITEVEADFDDILTGSTFSDVSDFSEFCIVSDASEEELLDIKTICELYFLDESTNSELAETQKDFLAEWTQIPQDQHCQSSPLVGGDCGAEGKPA